MNELRYEIIDEKLMTASVDLKDIDGPITIPIFININGARTVIDINNIDEKEIIISEYLKNKYKGNHIQYMKTKTPLNINRAFNLANYTYDDILKMYTGDFYEVCKEAYKKAMKLDLAYLTKELCLAEEQQNELISKIDLFEDYSIFVVDQFISDLDIIQNIIIPYSKQIDDIYSNPRSSYPEKKMEIFKIYNHCKEKMISRQYLSKHLDEMCASIKILNRGDYGTI